MIPGRELLFLFLPTRIDTLTPHRQGDGHRPLRALVLGAIGTAFQPIHLLGAPIAAAVMLGGMTAMGAGGALIALLANTAAWILVGGLAIVLVGLLSAII